MRCSRDEVHSNLRCGDRAPWFSSAVGSVVIGRGTDYRPNQRMGAKVRAERPNSSISARITRVKIVIAGGTGVVGKHVHSTATDRGHDVVALSRSSGQDVSTGAGLAEAIAGADVVIDVTSVLTTSSSKSRRFFTTATRHLIAAEQAAGVGHHLALSIVGIDGLETGYYAGKLAQEREVSAGSAPGRSCAPPSSTSSPRRCRSE